MIYQNLLTSFINGWNSTRSETIEILLSLTDEQLQFKPKGDKWQPLYWEFGCIGRSQIVYTKAVETGKMDFSLFHSSLIPKKTDYQTRESILQFLKDMDLNWIKAIKNKTKDENFKVIWPDVQMPLIKHISSLVEHERLHHGQFISYFTLAGFELPKGFKSNWAL